jgi:anaerobic ribonucleoside-triphosphate reductase
MVTGSTLAVVKNISQTRPFYARLMSNDGYCPECHAYIGEDNWDECPNCGAIIESDD